MQFILHLNPILLKVSRERRSRGMDITPLNSTFILSLTVVILKITLALLKWKDIKYLQIFINIYIYITQCSYHEKPFTRPVIKCYQTLVKVILLACFRSYCRCINFSNPTNYSRMKCSRCVRLNCTPNSLKRLQIYFLCQRNDNWIRKKAFCRSKGSSQLRNWHAHVYNLKGENSWFSVTTYCQYHKGYDRMLSSKTDLY